ncbi:ABC transporter permease [Nocardiopsis salina]|uniref:ABC transporter permease n=1 Tax=Nocardiopsis salina TaxID=245836 RepID=UPI00036F03B4|nr:FtsX-like permease family protein [Nocardiopsis salina]
MIGVRLSLTGGRENIVRTCLTAVGVGVATAMLLLAASLPTILDRIDERSTSPYNVDGLEDPPPGDDTALVGGSLVNADHRGTLVTGWVVEAEGERAPAPPGVDEVPDPGEMVVSPALAERLDDPENEALQRRLDHPVVGQIEQEGLSGPHELVYYLGHEGLEHDGASVVRLDSFGGGGEPYDLGGPVVLLLGVVGTVVMLTPVVVFLSAAVRFGGQARDRRLAAVRLMGADRVSTRRIAVGETLVGVLLGMLLGGMLFLAGRPFAELVPIDDGVFASDVVPVPALAALVLVLVPLIALWVVLLAVRGVAAEPLGVVRSAERSRPRLWWRLLLPVIGGALLYAGLGPYVFGTTTVNWVVLVSVGLLMVLLGTTAVLPWLLDRTVRMLPSSPLSLQIARRRMASGGGGPTRAVNGIVVTVAGAIALLTLLNGAESTEREGADPEQELSVGMTPDEDPYEQVNLSGEPRVGDPEAVFESESAVEEAVLVQEIHAETGSGEVGRILVAGCASLERITDLPPCEPGDVFATAGAGMEPGSEVGIGDREPSTPWTVPDLTVLESGVAGVRFGEEALLATPEAVAQAGAEVDEEVERAVLLRLDDSHPDAREQMLAAAGTVDPTAHVDPLPLHATHSALDNMKLMLLAGAIACLLMVVAGVTVGTVEQVRERRRVHAVLTAFGTRRRTLVASVLWQTAVPVALGVVTACVFGLALGALLVGAAELPMDTDAGEIALLVAAGAGAVLVATLVTVPLLLRTMRPDGLRSE